MPVEDSLGNVSEHVFKNKQPPEPVVAPRADDELCVNLSDNRSDTLGL